MGHKQTARSIWELDPHEVEEHDYEEFEALFSAAYEHAFHHTPSTRQIWKYLQRYFRFRVIPPWVRHYVKTVQGGDGIDNIGNAPLDPVIDLQPFFERLAVWLHIGRATASRDEEHTFEA
ncbi:MAG: hypothetical protein Kow006_11810 [Gammaproteobacteria bacterium]